MAVPGDCRNTVCISKSPGAVMGKQIHSKPYESLCESAQCLLLFRVTPRQRFLYDYCRGRVSAARQMYHIKTQQHTEPSPVLQPIDRFCMSIHSLAQRTKAR